MSKNTLQPEDSYLEKPSVLEKGAGSLVTNLAATLIAAFSANPVAALLPVLAGTLAAQRHKSRVEKVLAEISQTLKTYGETLKNLSDAQYKLVNETVLSIFQTVEEEKLEYLRRVIRNTIDSSEIQPLEAEVLSRIIRDISAEELRFLVEHPGVHRFLISDTSIETDEFLWIATQSKEAVILTGLISLGLVIPGEPTVEDSNFFRYSGTVHKLIELISKGNT